MSERFTIYGMPPDLLARLKAAADTSTADVMTIAIRALHLGLDAREARAKQSARAKARMASLTPEQRSELARKAVGSRKDRQS